MLQTGKGTGTILRQFFLFLNKIIFRDTSLDLSQFGSNEGSYHDLMKKYGKGSLHYPCFPFISVVLIIKLKFSLTWIALALRGRQPCLRTEPASITLNWVVRTFRAVCPWPALSSCVIHCRARTGRGICCGSCIDWFCLV